MTDKNLTRYWDIYCSSVYRYAEKQFNKVILPWLRENKYTFMVGNGEWLIKTSDGWPIYSHQERKFPTRIYNILTEEVHGLRCNDLGSLMPSYRGEDKNV